MLDQLLSELRADARFFVLEIDEYVAGARGLLANGLRPTLDVRRLVALVAQAEIGIAGRDLDRRRKALAIGDAERQVLGSQTIEDIGFHPGLVAELERCTEPVRQHRQEAVEHFEAHAQIRRRLKQDRAELRTERG